jgi:hypothetical protein
MQSYGRISALIALGIASMIAAPTVAADASVTCSSTWEQMTSPNRSDKSNDLNAIVAIAPDDIWAVGAFGTLSSYGVFRTLAEHWDGQTWTSVSSPNPGSFTNGFTAVGASSSTDVWAVGTSGSTGGDRALAERWDGSKWAVHQPPRQAHTGSSFAGVADVDASNVWAVGNTTESSGLTEPLAERWDGVAWNDVSPSPIPSGGSFFAVTATGPDDVWAVGVIYGTLGKTTLLTEHWDGTAWTEIPAVNPSATANAPTGVAVSSTGDVWLVGYQFVQSELTDRTLAERWDGTQWQLTTTTDMGTQSFLQGVAADSTGMWAVGWMSATNGHSYVLIERWDGTAWSVQPGPSPGTLGASLNGVASDSTDHAWAVGSAGDPSSDMTKTLIEDACP